MISSNKNSLVIKSVCTQRLRCQYIRSDVPQFRHVTQLSEKLVKRNEVERVVLANVLVLHRLLTFQKVLRPFVVQPAHDRVYGRIFQLLLKRMHRFQRGQVLNLAVLDHDGIVVQEYLHVIFE